DRGRAAPMRAAWSWPRRLRGPALGCRSWERLQSIEEGGGLFGREVFELRYVNARSERHAAIDVDALHLVEHVGGGELVVERQDDFARGLLANALQQPASAGAQLFGGRDGHTQHTVAMAARAAFVGRSVRSVAEAALTRWQGLAEAQGFFAGVGEFVAI